MITISLAEGRHGDVRMSSTPVCWWTTLTWDVHTRAYIPDVRTALSSDRFGRKCCSSIAGCTNGTFVC
jgi:hypothetical protein